MFAIDGWTHLGAHDGILLGPGCVIAIPPYARLQVEPVGFIRAVTASISVSFVHSIAQWLPTKNPILHHLQIALACRHPSRVAHLGSTAMEALSPKLHAPVVATKTTRRPFVAYAITADVLEDVEQAIQHVAALCAASPELLRPPCTEVTHAMRLLNATPAHPWTSQELAREVNLSESQLLRLFRTQVGTGPVTYPWGMRMSHLAELLLTTRLTISEAANKVGLNDPSTISRGFKRRYGVSPTEYTKRARQLPRKLRGLTQASNTGPKEPALSEMVG